MRVVCPFPFISVLFQKEHIKRNATLDFPTFFIPIFRLLLKIKISLQSMSQQRASSSRAKILNI